MKMIRPLRVLIALVTLIAVTACKEDVAGPAEYRWAEDVQLQDGQVVTAMRYSAFRGPRQTFSGVLSHYSIEFLHPMTKEKLEWKSQVLWGSKELTDALALKAEVVPSLDLWAILIKDSTVYVVVSPRNSFRSLKCPDPPYLLYRWEAGAWRRTPIEDIPYRKFPVNVSLNDDKMIEHLKGSKHLGVDVTATQRHMGSSFVIDLTRMSRQTADGSLCERPWRGWTAHESLSN